MFQKVEEQQTVYKFYIVGDDKEETEQTVEVVAYHIIIKLHKHIIIVIKQTVEVIASSWKGDRMLPTAEASTVW